MFPDDRKIARCHGSRDRPHFTWAHVGASTMQSSSSSRRFSAGLSRYKAANLYISTAAAPYGSSSELRSIENPLTARRAGRARRCDLFASTAARALRFAFRSICSDCGSGAASGPRAPSSLAVSIRTARRELIETARPAMPLSASTSRTICSARADRRTQLAQHEIHRRENVDRARGWQDQQRVLGRKDSSNGQVTALFLAGA